MQKLPLAAVLRRAVPSLCLGAAVLALFATIGATAMADTLQPPLSVQKPTVREPLAPSKPLVHLDKTATPTRPLWTELTPLQQLPLKPLSESWNSLSDSQKRKWLVLSKNYAQLSSAEQAKLQSRMTEWVTLSVQQRTQARLNYAQAKSISPAQKLAKWEAYQALSAEEKRKLAVKAPAATKGAAPAIKPEAAPHLTVVPTSPKSAKPGQKIATATHKLDQRTLLPRAEPASAPVAPAPAPAPASAASASEAAVSLPAAPASE
ncbi:MAG: DUF3106 domain-containing protein [Betaproteobacteria bacterium]